MAGFGGFGPMGVLPAQETPELARTRLEGIASRSGVPVNVLMALAEAGVQDADTAAAAMAKEIALGRKVEDLIGPDVMNRAYDIADQIYPRPAAVPSAERPQDANALRDLPAAIGASVARAGGSAIRGVGEAVAGAADAVNQNIVNPILEGVTGRKNAMGMAPNPLDGAANAVGGDRGAAGFLDSFISEDVKRDQADLIDPKADLFSPSTWSLGPRPTVRGAVYSALDVFGSMAPVVVVGLLTKSPAGAAAAGGSMSAGDAAGQAEQAIDLMAQTKLPDGRSQLEAESSVYQRLMQDGASPEQALEITKRRAAQQSALLAAIPGALGGAATQRIIGGLEGAVSRLPWAGRVAATAGLSGIEEGAQEVAEGIAGRTGINSGAGMNRSVTEGTFNEAILGAMGGAPMGAIGGAFSRRDMPQEAPPPAPPAPPLLALPAPTSGGTIFGAGPVSEPGQRERTQGQGPTALGVQQPAQFRPNPPADGSGGAGGAPAGRVIPSPAPAGVAPMGPISRIAASAPDLTPVPAPVQRFPDQKPGKEVELLDPETGVLHPAVFLREEPDGAVVRIEGGEFKLSPEEFDAARVGAMQAVQGDAKKPATPKPQQPVAVEAPVAQPVQPVAPMPVVPADGLASKAASKVRPPAPPVKQMTPKDAADALAALEANVTKNGGGWNKRLLKKRAELQALAGIKPESEVSNGKVDREDGQLPDGGARRRGPVGADAGAVSPGGERNKEGVPQGGADTGSILAGGGEGGVDPAAQPEPSAPLTPDERPRPSPITTPPSQRVQPDMLGGSAVSEEQMATKERRRKEWGRFLGIAEHGKSSDDMELEGREVRIRPGKFIVMAKNDGQRSNDDRVIDTHGMSRDTIAAAARGALSELDRIAPLPMKEKAAAAPPPAPPAPVTKEPKAAENGEDRFAENRKAMGNFAKGMRVEFDAEGPFKKADGTTVDRETRRGSVVSIDRKSGQGTVEVRVDGGVGGKGYDITIGAAQLRQAEGTSIDSDDRKNSWDIPANVPTAAEVKAAAAQADTKPTDAQKEAGNYQMGHIQWNGLDITIETAKGAMRRGKDRDGEDWSVKMPAHYGYIKGTRGADGDHLDIYMGPNPESTAVFIIDQVDADTGRFDEHKVMLGFVAREDAQAAYYEGFSDGRGEDRMGAITEQSVDQFKAFVQNNSWLLPISLHGQRGKDEPQSWDAGFADRFAMKPREVPSYFTQRKTSNGYQAYLRGWDAANKERMAPEIPGSTGTPGVLQVTKPRTGQTTTIDTRPSQPEPKPRDRMKDTGPQDGAVEAETLGGFSVGDAVKIKTGGRNIGPSKILRLWTYQNAVGKIEKAQIIEDESGRPHDVVLSEIERAAEAKVSDAKPKAKWNQIGYSARSFPLYEDLNGVRSYVEGGIRITETVGIVPGGGITIDKSRRGRDFLTDEEFSAQREAKADQWKKPLGSAKPVSADPDFAEISLHLTGQIERAKAKKDAVGDATVRRLRMNLWKAEESLAKALAAANFEAFAPHEADFPIAATALRTAIGKRAGRVDLLKAAQDSGRLEIIHVTGKKEAAPEKPTYGASNTLVSADRAAELRARLKDKLKNQLNAGIDPEILAIGAELAVFHIEAGARRFMDLAKAIADDLGTTPAKIKPYLRSWYNGARDMMEDAGLSIEGMDDAREVGRLAKEIIADSPPSQQAEEGDTLKSAESPEVAANVDQSNISPGPGQMGEDGKPETDRGRGTGAGPAAGTVGDRNLEGGATGPDAGDAGMGRAGAAGARSGGQDGQSGSGEPQKRPAAKRRKAGSGEGLADVRSDRDRAEGTGRANYHIADPDALFAGGPKARFAKNRAAMEAYQRVTDEDREPTPAELDAMAAFTGWGSFGQELFQGNWGYRKPKDGWTAEDQWLRDHLGKEGWESAQASIINAHYTDPPTVQAIWSAIEAMGFRGGRVLEPALGIGNFFGMMPRTLEANSQLFGIELEKSTGTMAKMLYPRANVRIMGYEKSRAPDGFYDLVIGNWPFANVKIADRRYDHLSPSLHDYFFVKALDQVRPGGLVVGITSAFSMDGQKNKGVRQHLARNAELVAAFRLPSGAFEKYAGTKVVTDLIILRKREEPAGSISGESWVQSVPYQTPAGDTISVNQYFIENPAQVLGTLDSGSGTTYGQKGMIVRRPDDIADQLSGIAARVPADAYKAVQRGKEPRFTANTTTDRRFSVTIGKDGALYQVLGDQMAPLEDVARFRTANKAETENRMAQVKYLVGLRRAAESVLEADQAGSEDADTKRKALKKEYQGFLKAHGRINDSFGLSLLRKLNDPNAGLIAALETAGGDPSPLMERPTVRATRKLDDPSIRDAFVMARNENVRLDLDRVADLSKKPVDEVIADLLASKAIYRTPGGGYEASDAYLSGNVRQKLREAREALADGEDMQDSVNALQEVQPPDVPYFQIEARFGADWIKPEVNRQFIIETLGLKSAGEKDIILTRGVTGWSVEVSDKIAHMPGLSDITGAPSPGRRGTGLSLRRFIEATMNTQTITVTYEDDEGTHKDTKATEQANQKAGDLRQKFGAWVWSDPERRVDAERDYNEVMNAVATPRVDGSFLEFPGMALKRGDQPFNLRQHQADAIWKGILNQRGIYGHEVGTGKTITMTGIAVESRRYGLARKPLLIAHNANSAAVAAEAQETYPGAKILYVNNLAPGEIDAQMARMATEDWDLIVIPHSLLDRMALTYDTLMEMAADDIAAYEREAIEAAEAEGQKLTVEDMENADTMKKMRLGVTAKEMVKARARLIQAIEKQAQRASREGAVSFERLGVDMILVDESHEFKKPPLATRMQVKGLNTGTSNKSLALRFLTSYVKKQRGGTGVHVFTGTPITNTLAEIYHQMFYVMDDIMAQNRVDTWDGFFKTFADTIADVELTSTSEFENVERLAAFINVSELRRMAGQFLDIVFASDMPEFTPRATDSGKTISAPDLTADERDFLENGRVDNPVGRPYKRIVNDIGPMGQDQKRILQEVVGHARAFKAADGRLRRAIMMGGGPDAPIVFNNVPNRASMDARLQEPDAEDHPLSKANRAVKNIARIYLDEPMSTQVLFMDEGYSDEAVSVKTDADGNKTKTKKRKFNLANDIVEKLVAAGVKREEIAIVAGGVTAEKKKAIADAMNARAIRVVIGQTKTLGVGVNMQRYLRAMHHLDAPWMPGDLEQRNGRGERQGNTWNTVLEYRYLTEGLDGRRWQVLAIKDRFIKAFLKAKEGVRNIEGDAADDAETMDGRCCATHA
ncbi:MAG: hypothetical protein LCH61_01245 [Proteobacteria bacterium]|nr:hypothetical protein [Pseudomonadota bacterium]